jgi:mediator of RNA polymerase II transcription subunit 31
MGDNNNNILQRIDSIVNPEERFIIELEFIQNLCNIQYLHFLATNGILDEPEFLNFLKYLQYFKQPQYLKHLLFPQALAFLDALIISPMFRRELKVPQFIEFVHKQTGLQWLKFEESAPLTE